MGWCLSAEVSMTSGLRRALHDYLRWMAECDRLQAIITGGGV